MAVLLETRWIRLYLPVIIGTAPLIRAKYKTLSISNLLGGISLPETQASTISHLLRLVGILPDGGAQQDMLVSGEDYLP
jgi:hypothetical protein